MCRSSITGCDGITSARSDVHAGSNRGPQEAYQTSPGCRNLVLAPSHTTSSETSVRSPWIVAKRARSTGIFLAKSPLNLGQAHTSQQNANICVAESQDVKNCLSLPRLKEIQQENNGASQLPMQQCYISPRGPWQPL